MNATLDHVFVCCSVGAPEADALVSLGLKEGSPNAHPGQGTACRRFFFHDTYLELLWVSEPREAQSEAVRPTRLWDRWLERGGAACPFGIALRPAGEAGGFEPPFPTWSYRPSYLPSQIAIEIARGTPLSEPGLFYLGFQRGRARLGAEPATHRLPISEVTDLRIGMPGSDAPSPALAALQEAGLVTLVSSDRYLLELTFDRSARARSQDLRPRLPVILRW